MIQGSTFRVVVSGIKVRGSGFGEWGSSFRVQGQGAGFRAENSGFRVQGSRFRIQGAGFRVQSSGFRRSRQGSKWKVKVQTIKDRRSRVRVQGLGISAHRPRFGVRVWVRRSKSRVQVNVQGRKYRVHESKNHG